MKPKIIGSPQLVGSEIRFATSKDTMKFNVVVKDKDGKALGTPTIVPGKIVDILKLSQIKRDGSEYTIEFTPMSAAESGTTKEVKIRVSDKGFVSVIAAAGPAPAPNLPPGNGNGGGNQPPPRNPPVPAPAPDHSGRILTGIAGLEELIRRHQTVNAERLERDAALHTTRHEQLIRDNQRTHAGIESIGTGVTIANGHLEDLNTKVEGLRTEVAEVKTEVAGVKTAVDATTAAVNTANAAQIAQHNKTQRMICLFAILVAIGLIAYFLIWAFGNTYSCRQLPPAPVVNVPAPQPTFTPPPASLQGQQAPEFWDRPQVQGSPADSSAYQGVPRQRIDLYVHQVPPPPVWHPAPPPMWNPYQPYPICQPPYRRLCPPPQHGFRFDVRLGAWIRI